MELSWKDPQAQRNRRRIDENWEVAIQLTLGDPAAESSSGNPGLPANYVLSEVPDCQIMKWIFEVSSIIANIVFS